MFSMAVSTIGEWLKLVPLFLLGSGGGIFKINIVAVKHLIINIMPWVPRKINK